MADSYAVTQETEETLANTVDDNGGIYFVPAFSGGCACEAPSPQST